VPNHFRSILKALTKLPCPMMSGRMALGEILWRRSWKESSAIASLHRLEMMKQPALLFEACFLKYCAKILRWLTLFVELSQITLRGPS
jgi:hypothetical protein